MLKTIKAIAIGTLIAVASVAIVVFGAFIGSVLLFLGAVAVIAVMLWVVVAIYMEHRATKR